MSWSPAQQAMLEAMGYTLFRAAAGAGGAPTRPAAESADAGMPPAAAIPSDEGDHARLLLALRRAAGGRDLAGLALPPLGRLRGDAAAKRALWPRLRALRRS